MKCPYAQSYKMIDRPGALSVPGRSLRRKEEKRIYEHGQSPGLSFFSGDPGKSRDPPVKEGGGSSPSERGLETTSFGVFGGGYR